MYRHTRKVWVGFFRKRKKVLYLLSQAGKVKKFHPDFNPMKQRIFSFLNCSLIERK